MDVALNLFAVNEAALNSELTALHGFARCEVSLGTTGEFIKQVGLVGSVTLTAAGNAALLQQTPLAGDISCSVLTSGYVAILLQGDSVVTALAAATLQDSNVLAAAPLVVATTQADITKNAVLAAGVACAVTTAADIGVSLNLAGASTGVALTTTTLQDAPSLRSDINCVVTASAAPIYKLGLAATANLVSAFTTGAIAIVPGYTFSNAVVNGLVMNGGAVDTGRVNLSSSAVTHVVSSATLQDEKQLAGASSVAILPSNSSLFNPVPLAAAITCAVTVVAPLEDRIMLYGAPACEVYATGNAIYVAPIAGTSNVAVTTTADALMHWALYGTSNVVATTTAEAFSGVISNSVSAINGLVFNGEPVDGARVDFKTNALLEAFASAAPIYLVRLGGASTTAATVAADVHKDIQLSGSVSTTVTLSQTIFVFKQLDGDVLTFVLTEGDVDHFSFESKLLVLPPSADLTGNTTQAGSIFASVGVTPAAGLDVASAVISVDAQDILATAVLNESPAGVVDTHVLVSATPDLSEPTRVYIDANAAVSVNNILAQAVLEEAMALNNNVVYANAVAAVVNVSVDVETKADLVDPNVLIRAA